MTVFKKIIKPMANSKNRLSNMLFFVVFARISTILIFRYDRELTNALSDAVNNLIRL